MSCTIIVACSVQVQNSRIRNKAQQHIYDFNIVDRGYFHCSYFVYVFAYIIRSLEQMLRGLDRSCGLLGH